MHENVDFSETNVGYGVVQSDDNKGVGNHSVISDAYHEDMDHALHQVWPLTIFSSNSARVMN